MVEKDKRREDEWFLENEKKLLEAAREARQKRERERAAHEKAEELQRLKQLHHMKCPKCGHDMKEVVLEEIAIDRCTFCEGVYFDAGELEALLQKKGEQRRGLFRRLVGV